MDNQAISFNGFSIEDRLTQATEQAHRTMLWLRPVILVVYLALLIAVFTLLNYRVQHQPLILAGGVGIMIGVATVLKILTDKRNRLFEPTKAQRAALDQALENCDYARAVALADAMLERVAGPIGRDIAANAYLQAGKTYEAHIVSQNAIEGYKRLLAGKPRKESRIAYLAKLSRAQTIFGIILMTQARYWEAELAFLEVMQTNPNNTWLLLNYVGALLYQNKSLDVALETIQKVEALRAKNNEPPQPTPAYLRAWVYALQGDRPAAEKAITEALQLAQTRNAAVVSEVRYAEGLVYQALGDTAEAQRAFDAAIQTNPQGLSAQLAKARLTGAFV